MRRAPIVDSSLAKLVADAAQRPMSMAERERQLVSLAYGNTKLENDRVTRVLVVQAVHEQSIRR
jgi:hypothetical protein